MTWRHYVGASILGVLWPLLGWGLLAVAVVHELDCMPQQVHAVLTQCEQTLTEE